MAELTDYERKMVLKLARLTVQRAPEGVSPEVAAACGVVAGLVGQGLEADDDTHRELTEAALTAIAAEGTELKTPWRFDGRAAYEDEYFGRPCYIRDAQGRRIDIFDITEEEARVLVEIVNQHYRGGQADD